MNGGFIALTVITSLLTIPSLYFAIVSIIGVNKDLTSKCHHDNDCNDWEECVNGMCYHICAEKICQLNEQCVTWLHNYTCECLPGFKRDDRSFCYLSSIRPYLADMINTTSVQKKLKYQNPKPQIKRERPHGIQSESTI